MSLEENFDVAFTARLALREKQVQQAYRPLIGIHKWFARRPGTVFRNLLLAEFGDGMPVAEAFFQSHRFTGVIGDPFAGGGTPTFEANRVGFGVVAADVNPMAYWIIRQGLTPLDLQRFRSDAAKVIADVEEEVGSLYRTRCTQCECQVPAKYFLWVKVQDCPSCGEPNDLFPGYLLAEDERHPKNVLACGSCGELNEFAVVPTAKEPGTCRGCGAQVQIEGPARRNRMQCRSCHASFAYPPKPAPSAPPRHRMWAIEYHCETCDRSTEGRFFKKPDADDEARVAAAARTLAKRGGSLPLPTDCIPDGDETRRLHRWGYGHFIDMFNDRQRLGLGLLLRRVQQVEDAASRHALLTVFSDFLRYQNMLCRYDTYALKCQDVFSVHGFPVGLVQCENNLLGIQRIGSGSYRHFVEKFVRAKQYATRPFETFHEGKRKRIAYTDGERICATLTSAFPSPTAREAMLVAGSAADVELPPASLDGVFTDPPYYDAVQYSELMDFCYAWLRIGLHGEVGPFTRSTSRHPDELTGNETLGRDLAHFADGLSRVFSRFATALKPGAPFVFTFHHNDPVAYAPLVVAILDAGLDCTAALPAPAEMSASLHISGTGSSVLDTVFVCRREPREVAETDVPTAVRNDVAQLAEGGVRPTPGDIRCLTSGHVARIAINVLRAAWPGTAELPARLALAKATLAGIARSADVPASVAP